MIACWHTTGSGEFAIDLGKSETLHLAGMRYLETDLSRDEAIAAWTDARWTGRPASERPVH